MLEVLVAYVEVWDIDPSKVRRSARATCAKSLTVSRLEEVVELAADALVDIECVCSESYGCVAVAAAVELVRVSDLHELRLTGYSHFLHDLRLVLAGCLEHPLSRIAFAVEVLVSVLYVRKLETLRQLASL